MDSWQKGGCGTTLCWQPATDSKHLGSLRSQTFIWYSGLCSSPGGVILQRPAWPTGCRCTFSFSFNRFPIKWRSLFVPLSLFNCGHLICVQRSLTSPWNNTGFTFSFCTWWRWHSSICISVYSSLEMDNWWVLQIIPRGKAWILNRWTKSILSNK